MNSFQGGTLLALCALAVVLLAREAAGVGLREVLDLQSNHGSGPSTSTADSPGTSSVVVSTGSSASPASDSPPPAGSGDSGGGGSDSSSLSQSLSSNSPPDSSSDSVSSMTPGASGSETQSNSGAGSSSSDATSLTSGSGQAGSGDSSSGGSSSSSSSSSGSSASHSSSGSSASHSSSGSSASHSSSGSSASHSSSGSSASHSSSGSSASRSGSSSTTSRRSLLQSLKRGVDRTITRAKEGVEKLRQKLKGGGLTKRQREDIRAKLRERLSQGKRASKRLVRKAKKLIRKLRRGLGKHPHRRKKKKVMKAIKKFMKKNGCPSWTPCSKWFLKEHLRQMMYPALSTLVVVPKTAPHYMDPQLQKAINEENARIAACNDLKAEKKPCPPSFLEQISCTRWQHLHRCTHSDCLLALGKCKKEVEPTFKTAFDGTTEPEFADNVYKCTEEIRVRTCCLEEGQKCCEGKCPHAKIAE